MKAENSKQVCECDGQRDCDVVRQPLESSAGVQL